MEILSIITILLCLILGTPFGAIGLGAFGALGLFVLSCMGAMTPCAAPVDALLIILCVVTAASCLEAAGVLNYLVYLSEKLLRKKPSAINFIAPLVAYLFTFFSGTGHVVYALLPIIAKVATETKIRPERSLANSVIASQFAITASPISAATATFIAITQDIPIKLGSLLLIAIPSTLIGVMVSSLFMNVHGPELPFNAYKTRDLESLQNLYNKKDEPKMIAVLCLFATSLILIVVLGFFEELRPQFLHEKTGSTIAMPMPYVIQGIMLSVCGIIMILSRIKGGDIVKTTVFSSGIPAALAIFGISWLARSFYLSHKAWLLFYVAPVIGTHPWIFAVVLFFSSILFYSQSVTLSALLPLGIGLGVPVHLLASFFPSVNGLFFIPSYPTQHAAVDADSTGSTVIGKKLLKHSFMKPGLITLFVSIVCGLIITQFVWS